LGADGVRILADRGEGDREFRGRGGLAEFQREIEPSIAGTPEMGWVLRPRFHGRGYATEAVQAVADWGDRRFAGGRTVCLIDPGNSASIRVAEKIGFREWTTAVYRGHATKMYERRG
jgi:RimJ/RimL family protein N-acetyltransferase